MRRKFTVYGLRFSKTSFWNRINTGFPDPAVATVLTVYGIETLDFSLDDFHNQKGCNSTYRLRYWNQGDGLYVISERKELQQYLPFTVLKLDKSRGISRPFADRCNSTYRLRYWNLILSILTTVSWKLQQYLPFTVLKLPIIDILAIHHNAMLQQYLPFTVLKPSDTRGLCRPRV